MEFTFDKNFNPVRINRPYINLEESSWSVGIYNPEGGPNYGLYSQRPNATCESRKHYTVDQNKKIYYPLAKIYL